MERKCFVNSALSKIATLLIFAIVFVTVSATIDTVPEEQPYDVDRGDYDRFVNDSNSKYCLRECKPGEYKICYYKWNVEPYTVLGGACGRCPTVLADCFNPQCVPADGYQRAVQLVSRRLPGPSIQVCKGDWIVVDVINQLPGKGESIHWHGFQQRKTPWMDGVSMVTQCPISSGQTFRYYFEADKAGTFFWHSHTGLGKVDGVEGSLIVRESDSESLLGKYYHYDLPSHVLFVQDWLHALADDELPGQETLNRGQSPVTYLINGHGWQLQMIGDGSSIPANLTVPLALFNVTKGNRYRFRIIGGTCLSCPFRIQFQNHKVTVINGDGHNPVKPVTVDSIEMSSGERYDVVVEATQPVAAYWILVQGLEEECRTAKQVAILCYKGATCTPDLPLSSIISGLNPGYILNPHISNCTKETLSREICVSQLTSLQPAPPGIRGVPDIQLIMPFGFYIFSDKELYRSNSYYKFLAPQVPPSVSSLVNNVSYMMPPSPPLTQYSDIPSDIICKKDTCKSAASVCECVNYHKVPYKALVEMIVLDYSAPDFTLNLTHPFHLHGYDFHVKAQGLYNTVEGTDPSTVAKRFVDRELEKSAKGLSLSQYLPSKDSIMIGTGGYAIIRFVADNPGFWLFHCHFAYHLETGMAAVIQVGELPQMKPPPCNFPKCTQFKPSFDKIFKNSKKVHSGKQSCIKLNSNKCH